MRRSAVVLIAAIFLAGIEPAAQSKPAAPDLDAVLERLDAYLGKYEAELSAVVADEFMVQEIEGRFLQRKRRRLISDIAFLRLPGEFEWLGFRHVRIVDGKPVGQDGPSLTELLATTTADAVAQASLLVNGSSKYNLGNPRTVNMPNLPLELLNRRYRHRYQTTLAGSARVRGHAVHVITLEELAPPPIVYNGSYNLQTLVQAWIDAESGAVWRAEVRLKRFDVKETPSKLRVEFAVDKGLAIMVPTEMREDFFVDLGSGKGHYTYSNFRRFQTSARIVPQARRN